MSPQRPKGFFSACWDEREAGVWRCLSVASGCVRVDWTKKNPKIIPGASGLFFSVAGVIRDFWNCAFLAGTTAGFWPFAS